MKKPAPGGLGYAMNDWRKTQYRISPAPDPLAEAEDFKFGIGGWLLIFGVIAAVALLVVGLLF